MSGYNYTHFVKEFFDRTRINIEIIEGKRTIKDKKEVTQLINSFLGLLVVPNEKFDFSNKQSGCDEKHLKYVDEKSYEGIVQIIKSLKKENKLFCDYPRADEYPVSDFIKHLRNAICHSGNDTLIFYPIDEQREIETLILYDTDEKFQHEKHQFCVELTIKQIREIVGNISALYVAVESERAKNLQNDYCEIVERYRNLLKGGLFT